ncbi:MAG: glycosyltransferase family 39 protein [Elusimicrobia bacterium]|nr:glycosyltransferase family 39 protein [Elusimicrobiota bacterium]
MPGTSWESGRPGLAVAILFSVAASLPFLGKAFHMDEPLFLYTAQHLLADPLRPGLFAFNWYGTSAPMAQINNNPPLLSCLLAPVLALAGGREWVIRLAFLPFDVLAAAALYLLAGRFLARPLWPVLIVLACPAYLVNMGHLMAEKPAMALGAAGLYGLVRGLEAGQRGWELGAMACLALAVLSKTGAVLFLAPAAALLLGSGRGAQAVMGFCGWTLSPALAVAVWQDLAGLGGMGPSLEVLRRSYALTAWPYKLRAFLAFAGGCGVVTALWPLWVLKGRPRLLAAAAAAAGILLSPFFDIRAVRGLDRVVGLVFACGAIAGFLAVGTARSAASGEGAVEAGGRASRPSSGEALAGRGDGGLRRPPGWPLWAAWIAAGAFLQLFLYWGVLARIVLFLTPPLVFLLAGRLEGELRPRALAVVYVASFVLTAVLGLGAAWVDRRYADSQRRFALEVVAPAAAAGRRVFFAGHWGLQYYLEKAGASPLDESRGGYEAMRRGDLLALSRVNSNNSLLGEPRLAQEHVIRHDRRIVVRTSVPLRLLSGWTGQAGFYADSWGFLPYSFSLEPVEEFALGEHQ